MSALARRPRRRALTSAAQRSAFWVAALGLAACASSHSSGVPQPASAPCVSIPPPVTAPESISVVISSSQWAEPTHEPLPDLTCGEQGYAQYAQISYAGVVANTSRVAIRSVDATMARDALDSRVDVLVTTDPAIISYAGQRSEYQQLQLPWDRTYAVLTAEGPLTHVSDNARRLTFAANVADAVRADSRIAEDPFWWQMTDQCPAVTTARARSPKSSRIVYRDSDRVAQGLAERLVALAGRRSAHDSALTTLLPGVSRDGARVTAAALPPSAFTEALHAGAELAYVVALVRSTAAPCQERERLWRAAPWLQSILPLVDTRSSVIVRRGRVGISVAADGSVHVLAAKNTRP